MTQEQIYGISDKDYKSLFTFDEKKAIIKRYQTDIYILEKRLEKVIKIYHGEPERLNYLDIDKLTDENLEDYAEKLKKKIKSKKLALSKW